MIILTEFIFGIVLISLIRYKDIRQQIKELEKSLPMTGIKLEILSVSDPESMIFAERKIKIPFSLFLK